MPILPDGVDDKLVEHLKYCLQSQLQDDFGDDTEAKIVYLERYAERVKNGDLSPKSPCHVIEGRLALKMVLTELKVNGQIQKLNDPKEVPAK